MTLSSTVTIEHGPLVSAISTSRSACSWARTAMLDQTCVSYDTAHGEGSCRALERKVLGRWTFHDYSRDESGQGPSADQVRMVNEHFAPLLQECLAAQALGTKASTRTSRKASP